MRLGRIIRVLSENATVVISGTKLADEIGTSRSEIWRLVQQLRAYGVEITGHPATGYQLVKVPDLLLSDILEPMLEGTRGAIPGQPPEERRDSRQAYEQRRQQSEADARVRTDAVQGQGSIQLEEERAQEREEEEQEERARKIQWRAPG